MCQGPQKWNKVLVVTNFLVLVTYAGGWVESGMPRACISSLIPSNVRLLPSASCHLKASWSGEIALNGQAENFLTRVDHHQESLYHQTALRLGFNPAHLSALSDGGSSSRLPHRSEMVLYHLVCNSKPPIEKLTDDTFESLLERDISSAKRC